MSAITPPITMPIPQREPAPHGDNYLNPSSGFMSWAFTLDHKRIGLMYMVGVLTAFTIGGILALMLRTELLTPAPTFNSDKTQAWNFYNHLFTMHGAVMVFLFIIPAIPAILGNFILPMQLGAKDVAFPRLNLFSFHLYVVGGVFFVYVLLSGVIYAATGH